MEMNFSIEEIATLLGMRDLEIYALQKQLQTLRDGLKKEEKSKEERPEDS